MTKRGVLRSTYRREGGGAGRFDVTVQLFDTQLDRADLLGMCTGTAIRPTTESSATVHEAVSTRLRLRPDPPELIDGLERWSIPGLQPQHPASHANDGPVAAWIERADGSTIELDVEPAELWGAPPISTRTPPQATDATPGLLPQPATVHSDGSLRLGIGVRVVSDPADRWPAVAALALRLGVDLAGRSGVLELDAALDAGLPHGAYDLEIDGSEARLRAATPTAITHGMVTLAQLIASGVPERVHVVDGPQHARRGVSVDLARRWFEPSLIERIIDLAAWRKLTHVQLHLTDDEAWRVPVEAYPALTEIGGLRGHGLVIGPLCGSGAAPYGRAYTPAEIDRWVARAEGLAVELVPEIDIPGHCHAALAAVPELRDPDDRSRPVSVQGFTDNVLVPGRATTRFLHEVFGSLADLFPHSSVLHVGGDEVPPTAWTQSPRATAFGRDYGIEPGIALAGALIGDAADAIDAAGRGWAGWQEVAFFDHPIAPAYVVAWTSTSAIGAVLACGHPVVASPSDAYYLDMAVDDDWATPGASWAGSTPLSTTCDFELANVAGPAEGLIGGQAAIWGEHVASLEILDALLFPRLDAVAEATWSGSTRGRADDIERRSSFHPTVLRQAQAIDPEASGA